MVAQTEHMGGIEMLRGLNPLKFKHATDEDGSKTFKELCNILNLCSHVIVCNIYKHSRHLHGGTVGGLGS